MKRIIELDEVIELIPKTRHAKNRIRENGSTCKVIQIRGDRFCVRHLNMFDAWRWIETNDDPDWDIKHVN